jgi:hypothetical protein
VTKTVDGDSAETSNLLFKVNYSVAFAYLIIPKLAEKSLSRDANLHIDPSSSECFQQNLFRVAFP